MVKNAKKKVAYSQKKTWISPYPAKTQSANEQIRPVIGIRQKADTRHFPALGKIYRVELEVCIYSGTANYVS